MPEHQLDDPDVHAVRQQPTGTLVTEVMPVQVDLPEFGAIDARTRFRAFGVVTVCHEQQRLTGVAGATACPRTALMLSRPGTAR
jgi:hypothetical protein